jgi:hypothetical protein
LEHQTGNLIRALYPNWQTMMTNRVSSVWVDNGRDGLPDGEFQLEQGGGSGQRDHLMPVGASGFDVFSITHQMNRMHYNTHWAYEVLGPYAHDGSMISVVASSRHNRGAGGLRIFASGTPYWGDAPAAHGHGHRAVGTLTNRNVLSSTREREIAFLELFHGTMRRHGWTNTMFTGSVEQNAQNIGLLIALANGWYIERYASGTSGNGINIFTPQLRSWLNNNFDNEPHANVVRILFPNQRFASVDNFMHWAESERVSTAGEVLQRRHGISIASTDAVLGTQDGSH